MATGIWPAERLHRYWGGSEHGQRQLAHPAPPRRLASWVVALLLTGFIGCLFSPPALALEIQDLPQAAVSCAPISSGQLDAWFENWNQALQSGDGAAVAQLYGQDALLLPTLSAQNRANPEGIGAYFDQFLKRHPDATVTSHSVLLGCNQAVDAGSYRFELHNPEETVEARFTFVYGFDGENWRIEHHHSSLLPS
ncbi:SgcJ/EcaC family oxidoreductase [Cyanobium sp. HWJ4-Hawea]|uniref:SgcJ/EcaC family oxidoreductase n=1 Tax=Cyanobium sp. HWJ4-Hawea TaxID=2823713 RepID=UPI0020CEA1F1|nr:SgcJ/EcaC family oxidoreductase [Cyanobium sp. HWJ4-Hawea]MCP9808983.1 SgcJ/EcaC family oxidoreductase [Cyanobium sp. HWJ4-Hawea]